MMSTVTEFSFRMVALASSRMSPADFSSPVPPVPHPVSAAPAARHASAVVVTVAMARTEPPVVHVVR
ncbi:hypothetical protein STAFG_0890 [Streptomyces afghaniensis 772]|uniref:Uncharacterized protein n=1 Tax=Streptomyces afghaniensis 772 TaxID=1283301 RepID=S4MRA9_9ACTN|nr:hypothetical protein STAFG_0890 [Streptomyces afghaniensis 772]